MRIAIIVQRTSCVNLTRRGWYDTKDLLNVMYYSDSSKHKVCPFNKWFDTEL